MVDTMTDKRGVRVSPTPEAMADKVAADFQALVAKTVAEKERFTVALAGGQTPKFLYSRLAQEPYRSAIPWSKVWVFWGDERCVPKDHTESNFGMANNALLSKVSIASNHVFRMHGEDPPPSAAKDYERQMREIFAGQHWPVFDLMLLGLGPDGHTASLMPGTPALAKRIMPEEDRRQGDEEWTQRWVVHNVVRSLQTVRITVTLPVINHAANIWFLVTGAKKKAIYEKVHEGPSLDIPASLVHALHGDLRWYVDEAVTGPIG